MTTIRNIIILFGVLVIILLIIQYFQKVDNNVIEGLTTKQQDDISSQNDCIKGCIMPTTINDGCENTIYKDDDGKCYKLCSYECTDPMASCTLENGCDSCGKARIYVNCDTGKEINDGPDLNEPSQETNYASSSINTGITNNSQKDLQGSVVYGNNNEINDSYDTTDDVSGHRIIEYHNHYYNMIPDNTLSQSNVSAYKNTVLQKGTPNVYRQGGDISNCLDNQTAMMEKGLSQKQDVSSVMNYGAYGTPLNCKSSHVEKTRTTTTGMYDDNTTLGVNSLYSLKL